MLEVLNLATREIVGYQGCNRREAVIAAFAQFSRKDFNTFGYKSRYGYMVKEGQCTLRCGDWTILRLDWRIRRVRD